ncbi:MAG: hypothetical protein ACK4TA_17570 [Saprospiraceae bacterium]
MYKFLSRNGQMIGFGLGALISILFLVSWLSGTESMMALPEEERYKTGIFDIGFFGTALLFILAVIALVGFGLMQTFGNLKSSMRGLIGVAILVGIFLISYATASAESTGMVADAAQKMNVSDDTVKLIGAGINSVIILSIVTFVALIASEIRNFFK